MTESEYGTFTPEFQIRELLITCIRHARRRFSNADQAYRLYVGGLPAGRLPSRLPPTDNVREEIATLIAAANFDLAYAMGGKNLTGPYVLQEVAGTMGLSRGAEKQLMITANGMEGIAKALREAMPVYSYYPDAYRQWQKDVDYICRALRQDNPRFDAPRFLVACGLHEIDSSDTV